MKAGYLNACTPDACTSVPYNCVKGYNYQPARTGQAYTFLDYVNFPNDRQYIQTQLKDSLLTAHCYYVEFFVNLPNTVKFACNNNGLLLTKNYFYVDTLQNQYAVYPANPQIVNYGNPIITDTLGWQKISSVYVAQGGERFITIGNFKYDNQTTILNVNPSGYHGAGYIIDDVSIYEIDTFKLNADAGADKTIANVGDSVFIGSLTNGITNITWYNSSGAIINTQVPGFYVKPTSNTFYIVEQTVCGYTSRDTVNVNVGTVPLKFTMYDVRFTNENQSTSLRGTKQSVENIWQTANEINVSHFNIQRSINGKDFVNIGSVKAGGVSSYSFLDNKLPITQDLFTIYYRIESIDFDGKKQYTETKRVKLNEQQETRNVVLYPNPAKDIVNIECKDGIKEIKLFNAMGKQIATGTNLRNDGSIQHLSLNVQHYPRGIYNISILLNNGSIKNQKLILQ